MEELLMALSSFAGPSGERHMTLKDLHAPNPSDRFQRWVGATLGKLRAKVAEGGNNAEQV
jgi:hypothetical protein